MVESWLYYIYIYKVAKLESQRPVSVNKKHKIPSTNSVTVFHQLCEISRRQVKKADKWLVPKMPKVENPKRRNWRVLFKACVSESLIRNCINIISCSCTNRKQSSASKNSIGYNYLRRIIYNEYALSPKLSVKGWP